MKKNGEKIFWGVFFILGAVFILMSGMGYLEGIGIVKLFFTVIIAACLIKSIRHISFSGILFSLAVLAIMYDEMLGIEELTPWPVLGAAMLGSIGLELLFHNLKKPKKVQFEGDYETVDIEDESCISYSTTFGSCIKYVNSDDFKQMNLECSFGDMKIYFDNAVIREGSASVNVKVGFGNIELYIPKEWQVYNHVTSKFGEVKEKNAPKSNGAPVLTLTGNVGFGDVKIIYV